MSHKNFVLRPLAIAALLVAAGSSQAALTVYTSAAAFAAATAAPGVDTFAGLSITGTTPSPLTRSAGAYSYTATASTDVFFGAGTSANPALSVNVATDNIVFDGFSAGVKAVGGNFYATDILGAFQSGSVILSAIDSLGATSTQTIAAATLTSFMGFVTDGASIVSLTLSVVQPTTGFAWSTADNLTLANIAAVPEPQTYAMLFAGLGAIGLLVRSRRG